MAIATYERILSLEPRNERAYLRLCESYFKVGQNQQAEGYCDDALEINPAYSQAWRQLGMVQYNRRNYESAIESFENCVNSGGDEIQCWYLRGLAHYYLGDCDTAWDILSESLPLTASLNEPEGIINTIREGLRLTTISCPGYSGRQLPTEIPPTPIPPTPIGGV
jgi:tetratricopeptide (TPR) repeat protein